MTASSTSALPHAGVSALVTGGTRGIGRAIVQTLSGQGARVTFTGRNEEAAQETIQGSAAPALCHFLRGDMADLSHAREAVAAAATHGGGLDVLVNNAGITRDGLLLRMRDEDWQEVLDVNLAGAFRMIREAARRLMKSARGRIVNVSSVVGLMGNAGQANYAASKAGLIGLTRAVARELAGRGVTVNAVAPGWIQTEMTQALPEAAARDLAARIPLGRLGKAEDVAEVVAFLASAEAGYITGQVIPVDGGMVM